MIRIIFFFFSLSTFVSCTALLESPGTLGVSSSHEFNCPSSEIDYALLNLSDVNEFKIKDADSTIVQWWKDGGFDFLNYKCLKIKKRLFMLTLDGSTSESTLSIRAYYNRKKKDWIFAKDFNHDESYFADMALEHLLSFLPSCE